MKQNLRLGDNHALLVTQHKRNFEESCVWTHAMAPARSGLGLALGMLFCLSAFHTGLHAQPNPKQTAESGRITPLQINDTIPDTLCNMPLQVVNHPDGRETIKLADYKGKLIILDFWATWCTSCIAAMPKLHGLQQRFGDRLVILPVTSDPPEKVSAFLSQNNHVRELDIFAVIDNGTLKQFFPHGTIPHYVWVDSRRSVYAVTDTDQLTEENIVGAIAGNSGGVVEKLNIDISDPQPLLLEGNLLDTELREYAIAIKGQHPGLSAYNIARRKAGVAYGRMYTNFPLLALYESVARRLFKSTGERYSKKRLLIESKKPGKLSYDPQSGAEEQQWNRLNLYSCDVIVPLHQASRLDSVVLQTLNNASEFEGAISYREMMCRVLRKKDRSGSRRSPDAQTNGNVGALRKLILALDHPATTHLPVIDESGFNGAINFNPEELKGLPIREINRKLSDLGLELVEAERRIAMFVIRDNQ